MSTADEMVLRRADFGLSEEQQAVRDAFATLLQRQCPSTVVRESEPFGFDEKLWRQLVEMRTVALGVPESAGGDGATLLELVIVAEQMGLFMAPVPFVETMVSARLLARAGSADAREWLDKAMNGDALVSVALHPGRAGERQLVPSGAVSDAVVGVEGDELVIVTRDEKPRQVANQGCAPLAWWDLGAAGGSRTVLATGSQAQGLIEDARREWKLLMAAAQVGLADGANKIAVDFAKERIAFGVPIGTFQAVSHPLVDVAMAVESARRLVWKAAWYSEFDPEQADRLVAMAYLHACETAMQGSTVGVHVQGGLGFTVESDEQLFFRRAKGWSLVAGDPKAELQRIADDMYGPLPA
jgi:alkylation response protein AidB-like acyl-CoA dehydrogenase